MSRPKAGQYDAATQYLKSRVPMTKKQWLKLEADAKLRAVFAADITQLGVVMDLQRALAKAAAKGTTLAQFKQDIGKKLIAEWDGDVANPSARMETIFRTNMQRAYSHGRREQMLSGPVLKARPFWMFVPVLDRRTSDYCFPIAGVTLPATHSFWLTHTPPLHYNCRSVIRALSIQQADEEGVTKRAPKHPAQDGFGGVEQPKADLDGVPPTLRASSGHGDDASSVVGSRCHSRASMTTKKPFERLRIELASQADGALPTEFRIFAAGSNRSVHKGEYTFTDASADSVMEKAHAWGNEFPLDYDHGMLSAFAVDPSQAKKAAGWFVPEVRAGELWATNVRFTPQATQQLKDREYRYISPAFDYDEERNITGLRNVALTNLPALNGLKPLMASQHNHADPDDDESPEPPMLKNLLAMLSMKADSNEADVIAMLSQIQSNQTQLLALCSATNVQEAMGRIAGWKAGAEKASALEAKLAAAEVETKKAAVMGLLNQAVADKKVTPAQVALLSQQPEEFLKAYLGTLSPVVPTGAHGQPVPTQPGTAMLSQEDVEFAKVVGVDPAKLLAFKADPKNAQVKYGVRVAPDVHDDDKPNRAARTP